MVITSHHKDTELCSQSFLDNFSDTPDKRLVWSHTDTQSCTVLLSPIHLLTWNNDDKIENLLRIWWNHVSATSSGPALRRPFHSVQCLVPQQRVHSLSTLPNLPIRRLALGNLTLCTYHTVPLEISCSL